MRTKSVGKRVAVCLGAAVVVGASSLGARAAVVINEVYPGGGSSKAGTTYTRDFVELYNTGLTAVNLSGYKLQYFSQSGTTANKIFDFGTGSSIAPGDYVLIVSGSAGTAGSALTGTGPDGTNGTTSGAGLSASAGAVQLIDSSAQLVDLVGYGTGTTHSETAPAPTPDNGNNNQSISRNATTHNDSGDNSADFAVGAPTPNAGTLSTVVNTPEPTGLAMLGVAGLFAVRRRRR